MKFPCAAPAKVALDVGCSGGTGRRGEGAFCIKHGWEIPEEVYSWEDHAMWGPHVNVGL